MLIIPEWEGHRRGFDVSRWQGEIDFQKLGAVGFEWVAIRSSVRHNYTDPMFRTYYDGFRGLDYAVGAYHVIDPKIQVAPQMDRFRLAVGELKLDFIVLDVELPYDSVVDLRNRVFWMLRELTGWNVPVIIYTADWFWSTPIGGRVMPKNPPNDNLEADEIYASGWPLWGADYEDNDADPFDFTIGVDPLPRGWQPSDDPNAHQGPYRGKWGVWQVTSKGIVPGISTNSVDENYMTEEMFQLIKPGVLEPPIPDPIPDPDPIPVPTGTFVGTFEGEFVP